MLILLMAINEWWLPQQPDSTTPRFHYFTRLAKWTKRKLSDAIVAARKRLASALGNAVARRSHGLVVALNNATELVARVGDTLALEAEQTYRALYALRHVTLPEYVQGYVRPVIATANQALALARGTADTLTAVSTEFANGLRSLPWGVPLGLPARVGTFWTTYKRLWDKVWSDLSPKVAELWSDIVPELRRRIEALERGVSGGIGNALQAIRRRLDELEEWRRDVVTPRIAAIASSIDLLRDRVLALERIVEGEVELGLSALWTRIEAIETELRDVVRPQLQALADALQPLLDAGIATVLDRLAAVELQVETLVELGLAELETRVAQVEQTLQTLVLPQLQALALRVDALAAIVSGEVELGLAALFDRIEAVETRLRDVIEPAIDELRVGLIEIRTQIETDMLPRLTALEAALAPAALAAAVLAALRIAAPNLFCRNVTDTTRRICATDEAFWAELLAGTLIFGLALDPRIIARAGQEFVGAAESIFRETALR